MIERRAASQSERRRSHNDDVHEVSALRYADHARMRSELYIFGGPHDEKTSISYYVSVINVHTEHS